MIQVDTNILRDSAEQIQRVSKNMATLSDRLEEIHRSSGISDDSFERSRLALRRVQGQIIDYESVSRELAAVLHRAADRYNQAETKSKSVKGTLNLLVSEYNPYRRQKEHDYTTYGSYWIDHELIRAVFAETIRMLLAETE